MEPISMLLGGSLLAGLLGGGSKQTSQNSSSNSSQSGSGTNVTDSTGSMTGNTTGNMTGQNRAFLPPELLAALKSAGINLGDDGLTGDQSGAMDWFKNNLANGPLGGAYSNATNTGNAAAGVNADALHYLGLQQNNGSFTLGKYFPDNPTINGSQAAGPATVNAGTGADFAGAYATPLTNDYVNGALNDFDTGVDRGFNALRANNAGAFANKRTGVAEGTFLSDAARQRGNLSSGLKLNAFNTAAGLGMSDADRAFGASAKNADLGQSNNQFNAGLEQSGNMFNSNLIDSRQKTDIAAAETGEQRRLGVANNLMSGAGNLANINSANFGNALNFNNSQMNNNSAAASLASLSPQQLAQLIQSWSIGAGSDTSGTTSGTQTGTTTGNSTTNSSFNGNSNGYSTGTATQPGDPFGTMAKFLTAGGYVGDKAGWFK